MKTNSPFLYVVMLAAAAMLTSQIGCETPEIDDSTPAASPSAEADDGPQAESAAADTTAENETAQAPAEPREFTALDPKKGKKSRSVGGYAGAVFGARFWAEHQMILNNINYALKLYNAEHGNYPKTHDEFMTKIIRANQIQLPELDEGVEYMYDPEDHTLKVQQIAE